MKTTGFADTVSIVRWCEDIMIQSSQGVCVFVVYTVGSAVCGCVCESCKFKKRAASPLSCDPQRPSGGQPAPAPLYLKLRLVYLMNGCLCKKQGGSGKTWTQDTSVRSRAREERLLLPSLLGL